MNDQVNMDNISRTANVILVVLFLAIISFFGFKRFDQTLRERAIDNCARISKYETSPDGGKTKVSYPVADVYKTCLKDKGL